MIRIEISAAAYAAYARAFPRIGDWRPKEAHWAAFTSGWTKETLNRLKAAREAAEGFSETILRLAKVDA